MVNGLELLLLLMQCKDGNLFFGPLSFPFTLPNFLPFIQAFICYPFHPSSPGWGWVFLFRCRVGVFRVCTRHRLFWVRSESPFGFSHFAFVDNVRRIPVMEINP